MITRKNFAPLAHIVMMFALVAIARLQNVVSADAIYLSCILVMGFTMLYLQLSNMEGNRND